MSNISKMLPLSEFTPRHNRPTTHQAAAYVREQSVNFQEKLDTNLVLETKEGDKVSLTANSYSQMSGYMYDSRGIVVTDSGFAATSVSEREITLASGQSFSFTVEGHLSEEELQDIESLLSGLDGVITEMKEGDMDDAFGQALGLGGYDTVSSFSADISYQQAYTMESSMAAAAVQTMPAEGHEALEQGQAVETAPQAKGKGHKYGHLDAFDKFFEKLANRLDKHEDRLLGFAKNPIEKLFNHHLDEIDDEESSLYNTVEQAMDRINSMIEEMMSGRFDEQIEEVLEEQEEVEDGDDD